MLFRSDATISGSNEAIVPLRVQYPEKPGVSDFEQALKERARRVYNHKWAENKLKQSPYAVLKFEDVTGKRKPKIPNVLAYPAPNMNASSHGMYPFNTALAASSPRR